MLNHRLFMPATVLAIGIPATSFATTIQGDCLQVTHKDITETYEEDESKGRPLSDSERCVVRAAIELLESNVACLAPDPNASPPYVGPGGVPAADAVAQLKSMLASGKICAETVPNVGAAAVTTMFDTGGNYELNLLANGPHFVRTTNADGMNIAPQTLEIGEHNPSNIPQSLQDSSFTKAPGPFPQGTSCDSLYFNYELIHKVLPTMLHELYHINDTWGPGDNTCSVESRAYLNEYRSLKLIIDCTSSGLNWTGFAKPAAEAYEASSESLCADWGLLVPIPNEWINNPELSHLDWSTPCGSPPPFQPSGLPKHTKVFRPDRPSYATITFNPESQKITASAQIAFPPQQVSWSLNFGDIPTYWAHPSAATFVPVSAAKLSDSIIVLCGFDSATGEGVVLRLDFSLSFAPGAAGPIAMNQVYRGNAFAYPTDCATYAPSADVAILDSFVGSLVLVSIRNGSLVTVANSSSNPNLTQMSFVYTRTHLESASVGGASSLGGISITVSPERQPGVIVPDPGTATYFDSDGDMIIDSSIGG